MLLKGAFCTLSQMSCIIKVCSCCLHSSFPGIIPSMHWTTRTCGSSGTGPNTSWPSSRGACFSTTTPNSACLRSARWRRWREPKIVRSRTTSPLRPTETRLHVRPSSRLLQDVIIATKNTESGLVHANILIVIVMMVISCPVFAEVFLQTFYRHCVTCVGTTNKAKHS